MEKFDWRKIEDRLTEKEFPKTASTSVLADGMRMLPFFSPKLQRAMKVRHLEISLGLV